ncbi:MAG: pilus assembly PilX N-terminal domain-containing protein [Candidatus Nealsonbacteria bacterium]
MKYINSNNNNRGITLYLSVMIMTVLLGIALGLNSIFVGQVKTIRAMGNSAIALTAADAGIEDVLFDGNNRQNPTDKSYVFPNNKATYDVKVTAGGVGVCPITYNFCIKSIGAYLGTRRAIEVVY